MARSQWWLGWLDELKDLVGSRKRNIAHQRLHDRLALFLLASFVGDILLTVTVGAVGGEDLKGHWLAATIWSTSMLTTGGSSYAASSSGGHVAEVLAQIYCVTIIAALAGTLSAFFLSRDRERDATSTAGTGNNAAPTRNAGNC